MAQNYVFEKSLVSLESGKKFAGTLNADGQTQFNQLMEEVAGPAMLNIKGANYKIAEHAKSGAKSHSRKKSKGKSPRRSSKRKPSKVAKNSAKMKRSSSKKKSSKGKKSSSKKSKRKASSKRGGLGAKASSGSDIEIQEIRRH